jgi:Flp pilus assembly pilin Flp
VRFDQDSRHRKGVHPITARKSTVVSVFAQVRRFVTRTNDGASLAEYAMLVAIVTVALIAAVVACTGAIRLVFDASATQMTIGG